MSVRSVFFGTPAIAVTALEALAGSSELVGVVCQPDRPRGRGLELAEPEVKRAAARLGAPVYQPERVRTGELSQWLRERNADVALVLAYGRILPPDVLAIPKHGCLNLHASLLPAYRGAAPINWALIQGESESGMSLMQMDAGLDTGPVYMQRKLALPDSMDAGDLSLQMAELAGVMVREDVPRVLNGELIATPQDERLASHAPLLLPQHLALDCTVPARQVVNLVRGLSPRPGAKALINGKLLKILCAEVVEERSQGDAGRVLCADRGGIVVQANPGSLRIVQAQPEGKKVLSARDLVNGRAIVQDQVLRRWSPAPR